MCKVLYVTQRLLEMGCYEISLGDTIGTGAAGSTHRLLDTVLKSVPAEKLAVHFHDTYGQVHVVLIYHLFLILYSIFYEYGSSHCSIIVSLYIFFVTVLFSILSGFV